VLLWALYKDAGRAPVTSCTCLSKNRRTCLHCAVLLTLNSTLNTPQGSTLREPVAVAAAALRREPSACSMLLRTGAGGVRLLSRPDINTHQRSNIISVPLPMKCRKQLASEKMYFITTWHHSWKPMGGLLKKRPVPTKLVILITTIFRQVFLVDMVSKPEWTSGIQSHY